MFAKKSHTFIRYFKFYIYIFLSISILFSVLNIYTILNMQNQIYENHRLTLQKMADEMAEIQTNFDRIAGSISRSSAFCSYNLRKNLNLPHNVIPQIDILGSTADCLSGLGIVYTQSLYPEINHKLFFSEGIFSLESFCSTQLGGRLSGDALRQAVDSTSAGWYFISYEEDSDQPILLYLLPVPSNFNTSPAVILFEIDYAQLARRMNAGPGANSFYLYDREGKLLLYNGSAHGGKYARALKEPAGNNILLESTVQNYGLRLCLAFDRTEFYQPLAGAVFGFIIILLMALLLGFGMAYGFASRALQPIQRLVEKALPSRESYAGERLNELEVLDQSFDRLTDEYRQLSLQVGSETALVQRQLLLALLAGQDLAAFGHGAAKEFLERFSAPDQTFIVFVLMLEEAGGPSPDLAAHQALLCSAFEERCTEVGQGYAAEMPFSSGITGVLLTSGEETVCHEAALAVCDSLHLFAAGHNQFTVTAALSSPSGTLEELPAAYRQAVKNAEYRFFLQGNETITPRYVAELEERRRASSTGPVSPDTILQAVKNGSHSAVMAAIENVFSLAATHMSLAAYKFAYFDILSTLEKMLLEAFPERRPELQLALDQLYSNSFESLSQAKQSLARFCCELADAFTSLKENEQGKSTYARILAYIEENYTSPDLSLSSIAQAFGLSPSYLTRFFKEKNGSSLMQYIDRMRFEQCKRLLVSSSRPIREIVELTGYVDEANFSRKFKRLEGVSPTRFRQLYAPPPQREE
ncbi:MAG: helix-turn-helix transcriptional regulator [Provencibacterium sp.]|jgi:AraC-like DNA-binding protein|nr:helix-turn-helix transcriptional regulator [Provencibacterium sp.]